MLSWLVRLSKLCAVLNLIIAILIPISSTIITTAQQSAANPINLRISKVVKDQKDELTRQASTNVWVYDDPLGINDSIKYGWSGVDLNVKYRDNPALGGGYLKIYNQDDSSNTNFITDYGTSPLPISKISSKLVSGDNQLLFVYINSSGVAAAKVVFQFNFDSSSTDPSVEVISPSPGSVLAEEIDQNFVLKLSNFSLESTSTNQPNKGLLNVYYNEVIDQNLIKIIDFSKDLGNNSAEVNFNTKNAELAKLNIADSTDTKFIFVLASGSGELLPYRAELSVQTNYNNSLDVGFPRITILEPRKDRTDLKIDGERKFILQVDNFTILPERQDGQNEPEQGYLQIFVDETPREIIYPDTEFSLNELGVSDLSEGKKTVRVQLVNKDFTKIVPEASDSVDIIFTSSTNSTENAGPQVQNNNWRLVIVVITVVLVIGGIIVLIIKG
ncbi:MAG: hypothetical protein AAGF07_02630 [Patescibacteria group bacterium]